MLIFTNFRHKPHDNKLDNEEGNGKKKGLLSYETGHKERNAQSLGNKQGGFEILVHASRCDNVQYQNLVGQNL